MTRHVSAENPLYMENVDYKSYQQIQTILRSAYNIEFVTHNKYFTCCEAVNLEQNMTGHQSLNGASTTLIFYDSTSKV